MSIFGKIFSSDKKNNGVDEHKTYNVYLIECDKNKIKTIQEIRLLKHMELADTKALAESAPVVIASGLSKDDALNIKLRFDNAGAKAEVKPSK